MAIEKIINNNYRIFKLAEDELNYTFVADGPLMRTNDVHYPRITKNIETFSKETFDDHMTYLESKGCTPRNSACAFISFSYDLPYESALVGESRIWRAQKLSDDEKDLFEKHILQCSEGYWNKKTPR